MPIFGANEAAGRRTSAEAQALRPLKKTIAGKWKTEMTGWVHCWMGFWRFLPELSSSTLQVALSLFVVEMYFFWVGRLGLWRSQLCSDLFFISRKKPGGVAASTLQCESFYDAAVSWYSIEACNLQQWSSSWQLNSCDVWLRFCHHFSFNHGRMA